MQETALSFIEAGLSALERSVADRDGELRNVQLATVSPDRRPAIRTLVLRAFERHPAVAEMHTDARAGKVRDIELCDQISFLAWSPADQLQLRFTGTARLHNVADGSTDGDIARARWSVLPPAAHKPYGLRAHPGEVVGHPEEQVSLPFADQLRLFTVIRISLISVDMLRLGPGGSQTRAQGRFGPPGIAADWMNP